jgi:ketosteroid isomerase-like protein
MSKDEAELVRVALECAGRGDWDGFMGALDPDVVWTPVAGDPEFAVHRGIDAVRAWGNTWLESFPDMRWEGLQVIEAPDSRVVAVVRLHGRGSASGAGAEYTYGTVFKVRAGKIVEVHEHRRVGSALEAAGLPADTVAEAGS